jgi:DNA polymerase-3 subunit beta
MKHEAIFSMTADRAKLRKAFATAATVVANFNTIPILSYARLRVVGDVLKVIATDLDMEVELDVADGGGAGDVMLPCRSMARLLAAGDTDEVTIAREADGDRAAITMGNLCARLATLPVEDYPAMVINPMHSVVFPERTLSWMIDFVRPCISTEETRYYLNGLCLQMKDRKVIGVATDGHRMAARTINLDMPVPDMNCIVPRKTIAILRALAGDGEVDAAFESEAKATFYGKGWTLRTKMIDGTFPDWNRIVPKDEPTVTLAIDKAALRRFLSAAGAVSLERSQAVKFVAGTGGVISLSHRAPDTGDVEATVKGQSTGTCQFGLNGKYVASLLPGSGDEVKMHFYHEHSPLMFPTEHEGDIRLLMPMRVW